MSVEKVGIAMLAAVLWASLQAGRQWSERGKVQNFDKETLKCLVNVSQQGGDDEQGCLKTPGSLRGECDAQM